MDSLSEVLNRVGVATSNLQPLFEEEGQTAYRLSVHGSEAIRLWQRLRALVPETGHWPVLLGSDEDLEVLNRERRRNKPGAAAILRQAAAVDVESLFIDWQQTVVENARERLREQAAYADEDPEAQKCVRQQQEELEQQGELRGLPRGPWPEEREPRCDFIIPCDIMTRQPLPEVYLGLLPTPTAWHVPAFLKFGAWNSCPLPQHHVAVMRYWGERYGAEVVGITHETVEMQVARPPQTQADALHLAREQYLYCEDIVDQGTWTLDNLAASLLGGTCWYFWWD